MTLIKHELKQSRVAVIVWTAAIGFLIAVCIFMYPEMKGDMDGISDMFSSMGSFSEAFGMDKISFGTLTGFYAVECGNILGLGGAFFASLCAISVLAKEENERTAEFLLTHPISRQHIITGKLISVFIQIIILNAVVYGVSIGSIAIVGEEIPFTEISLLHLAYLLMQIELAGICSCRNMLWHFCFYQTRQHRNRSWRCSDNVFSEHCCEHIRQRRILEVYNSFRICRGNRDCKQFKS